MNQVVLELDRVCKSFKKTPVLQDASLRLPRGTVLGLLGKNGAGKTTLLKCVLGLLRVDEGQASVFGEDSWDLTAQAKARLGYVPQVVNLYPWMRAWHVIEYTASFYSTWNHDLVDSLVTKWEIDPNQRIEPMSPGEVQKLGILLAMGHEPALLVLDEPAASLDPSARREFLSQVLEIAAEGDRTVLFSTHITSDIERVADSVAILKDGKIICHDQLDELKESVKRLHVAMTEPVPQSFSVPGTLAMRVQGNEALVSVREAEPEMIDQVSERWDAQVSVEDLNLEDIFLEMHRD